MSVKDIDSSLEMYVKATLGKKAIGLVVLDVRGIATFTDVFIICSGRSNRQVTAIAEHIEAELRRQGKRPLSVEGAKEGRWVLLDYGHVIVHVFYESVREFYNLEGLWTDARRVDIQGFVNKTEEESETDSEDDDD